MADYLIFNNRDLEIDVKEMKERVDLHMVINILIGNILDSFNGR